jgi:hypothetical protein
MTVKFSPTSRLLFAFVCATCFSLAHPAWAAAASTTTALTLGSSGKTVVENGTIASGSVLTLTATVTAGTSSVNVGSVSFCDASAPLCSDIHLIGTAQITQSGTAVFKFIPGVGTHTYKAVFAGTPNGTTAYAGSSSSTSTVTVTGTYPTISTLTSTGIAGSYSLTATVSGAGSAALTGAISFVDTTSANAALATQITVRVLWRFNRRSEQYRNNSGQLHCHRHRHLGHTRYDEPRDTHSAMIRSATCPQRLERVGPTDTLTIPMPKSLRIFHTQFREFISGRGPLLSGA